MKNKVLMISYHFPPIAGAGVYRTLKFVKYLPYFNWMPFVLCVKRSKFNPLDDTLLNQVPPWVKVYRTDIFESKIFAYAPGVIGFNPKWFQIPDKYIGWIPFVLPLSKRIIKNKNIDLIYTTSPPETAALIGLLLKKKTGKPWVVDFRDPWAERQLYPTRFHQKLEEYMEKKVAECADKIIFNTEINKRDFLEKYNVSPSKCITIMNGFDPEDFKNLEKRENDKFTLTYSGIAYGAYDVERFLSALKQLIEERPEVRRNIIFVKTGVMSKEFSCFLESLDMNDIVDVKGHLPYVDSLRVLVNSDVLVVTLLHDSGKRRLVEGWVPSKIFNYLGAKRPILALAPENSTVAEIVKSTNTGVVVRPDDTQGIKEAIYWFYEQWKEGRLEISPDEKMINRFDRRELTKKLVDVFNECIRNKTT